jgi:hypothetical protein
MELRVALFVVSAVVSAAASVAHAQAPGEAAPVQASAPSVMDRRWAVSAGIGWESFEAKVDNGYKVTFAMVDLAGRFRIRREIELGLGLVAGGAEAGELTTGGLFIDGRYRFRAEKAWNIYVGLGLGVQSVANKDGTEDEKKGRGALRVVPFGIERRWSKLAIFGEVRVVGVAQNKELAAPAMPFPAWQFSRYGLGGGHVVFGGNLYF